MSKRKINTLDAWVPSAIVTVIIVIIAEIISDRLISDTTISNNIQGNFAGIVSILAVISFIVSTVAIFKVKKWLKVVAIICALITIPIFGWSLFVYGFSGYGSPY